MADELMPSIGFYGFIIGLFAGRFTGFISNVIITIVIMYFLHPQLYSFSNLRNLKDFLLGHIINVWSLTTTAIMR